jgi:phosphate-selective porin OprO/OprP
MPIVTLPRTHAIVSPVAAAAWRSAACGALLLLAAHPASAQVSAQELQQQIQTMQRQMEALQQQLQTMQNQMRDTQAQQQQQQEQMRATQAQQQQQQEQMRQVQSVSPPPANLPKVTMSTSNRPGICSADGANCIELTSRTHLDFGDYLNVTPQSPSGPHSLTSGINARRARIGVLGKFFEDWYTSLVYDFGGSSDSGAAGINASGIQSAFIGYGGLRPFTFEVGYLDVPLTLEEATSSNDLIFLERGAAGNIANNLLGGDRAAFSARYNDNRYWAGVYLAGPLAGARHSGSNGQQLGVVGRTAYQVLQTADYSLHVGADIGRIFQPRANGSSSTSIDKTVTLSDRPELRVDPTTFLTTGAIPADDATIFTAELAGGYGRLFGQAEYNHFIVDQSAAGAGLRPTLDFDGGYVLATWSLTGEQRKYIPAIGAYSAITPAHPFSISTGGWGAFELAARYSIIDLDSNVTPGIPQATTGGVFGGTQKNITLGLNWFPNSNLRFALNYIHSDLDKRAANGSTQAGVRIDAIAARAQTQF